MTFTGQLAGLAGVLPALQKFGIAPDPLLAPLGLSAEDLQAVDRRVEARLVDEILGRCVRATGCDHFGLLAGASGRGLASAGVVGIAARHASTVGEALADVGRLRHFNDPMGLFECRARGEDAVFSYQLQAPDVLHRDQIYDLMLALMRAAMRDLLGAKWAPELVYLPRRRPVDVRPYLQALGPHLKFEALRAGIVFRVDDMMRPLPGADPVKRRDALQRARQASTKREPALLAEVRRAIRASMEDRQCSRAEVSRRLGLHERAFLRRLQACGVSFQQMLEATRLSIAKELLADTRVPIGRIAVAIGYQDTTAFGRAFRRQVGTTPRGYRDAELRRTG